MPCIRTNGSKAGKGSIQLSDSGPQRTGHSMVGLGFSSHCGLLGKRVGSSGKRPLTAHVPPIHAGGSKSSGKKAKEGIKEDCKSSVNSLDMMTKIPKPQALNTLSPKSPKQQDHDQADVPSFAT